MHWRLLFAGALLTGCSMTPLKLASVGGVATAQKISPDLYRVPLRARGPNCQSRDECTLLGAAEAARGLGKTHFMIIPGHGGPSQKGFAYIKVFKLEPGAPLPSGALSVEEIAYFFDRTRTPDQAIPSQWNVVISSNP
jgi:hypothetical protein